MVERIQVQNKMAAYSTGVIQAGYCDDTAREFSQLRILGEFPLKMIVSLVVGWALAGRLGKQKTWERGEVAPGSEVGVTGPEFHPACRPYQLKNPDDGTPA